MADLWNREGSSPRFRAFGCVCALASLVLPAVASGQSAIAQPGLGLAAGSAKREAAARPTAGTAVIQYEESRGSAIIYLEEAGGLVSPVAPAIASRREAVAAPARPVASPSPAAATPSPRIVTRQVADAESVGKR